MRKLIERVRRGNLARWPWRMRDARERVAFLRYAG